MAMKKLEKQQSPTKKPSGHEHNNSNSQLANKGNKTASSGMRKGSCEETQEVKSPKNASANLKGHMNKKQGSGSNMMAKPPIQHLSSVGEFDQQVTA